MKTNDPEIFMRFANETGIEIFQLLSVLSRDKHQKSSGLFISLRVLLGTQWV